jgi:IclR family transcriptional regulator, acetate operon repressor
MPHQPETVRQVLAGALPAVTPETQTSPEELSRALEATRSRGYAVAVRTFESEVVSVAAPIFDGTAWPIGSLSVACIASRWAPGREADIARMVVAAAGEVTRGIGGEPSRAFAATSLALSRQPVEEIST